ncbi:MAG: NAD(P)H-dependent oxidoreductase, partial [Armatimonadota bacterium]|nr:NAD(P)H-dependent oxidoreductase [Armatimonadota bacterium]
MKKVLIINAHLRYPEFSEGNLTKALIETATEVFENNGLEVKTTKIEDGYDPNEEMEKHLWADLVILQTPVNWMSAPWIYKKYADELF